MLRKESFVVDGASARLRGDRWKSAGQTAVLLHPGVADRRSWNETADILAVEMSVVTYDRRGFGETPPGQASFSHVTDLLSVIDDVSDEPVWLVGNSAGGRVALDAALLAPDRVAGLVLLAPAVSGAPVPDLDAQTARLNDLIEVAEQAGDLEEMNRWETWLWLDGPAQPEGRVHGSARALALEMNAAVLRNAALGQTESSGIVAWNRLEEIDKVATVACGEFDVPFMVERSRELAKRLPKCQHQLLGGMAHLPQMERPTEVARLILETVHH